METQVRNFIRAKISQGHFTGASVAFGQPFKKLVHVQEGTLAKSFLASVDESTTFDLQSITKALSTSLLFLILSHQKKLSLDQSIDAYLPPLGPRNLANKGITFRHLLLHTSGLSDADLEGDFQNAAQIWQAMFSTPLHHPPGSQVEYCDLGYRVLGKILELQLGSNLEVALHEKILIPNRIARLSYSPVDSFNVVGTPDAHGIIDDEQVHALGGILGCDGLFGNAQDIFELLSFLLTNQSLLGAGLGDLLAANTFCSKATCGSFFEALAFGSKSLGWEVNPSRWSYAGKFHQDGSCFEKAGGAGTFIWFDQRSKNIFVYLTNHGKPKPFTEKSWNQLVMDLEPHTLSNTIYDAV